MNHRLNIKLNEKSIQEAIDWIEEYKKQITDKSYEIARLCAERGVEIARVNVLAMSAVFSGELVDTIHLEKGKENGVFFVVADSEHAAFVEFGTGYNGKFSPYKGTLPDGVNWQYIVGDQIVSNIRKGVYGWFYKGDDGNIYFTEGMPSRPFMHNTEVQLEREVIGIVKEVFG